jgi:hypothetical protein
MEVKMRILLAISLLAASAFADTWVNGYTRKDGTYVPGHWRSDPNTTRNDNYSTEGNVNPYTGQPGTKPRDYSAPCTPRWIPGYTDSEGAYHSGHYSDC